MLDSVTLKLKTGIKQCPSHSFRGAINLNNRNSLAVLEARSQKSRHVGRARVSLKSLR